MSDTTARLRLPTLRAGQAQKELTHNEALALIDLLLHPAVTGFAVDSPPAAPEPGASWVVGPAPTGDWAGHTDSLAGWTEGGWRFVAPIEGMTVWIRERAIAACYAGGTWRIGEIAATRVSVDGARVLGPRQAGVPDPAGGDVIDIQARAALSALLAALRNHGLIFP